MMLISLTRFMGKKWDKRLKQARLGSLRV